MQTRFGSIAAFAALVAAVALAWTGNLTHWFPHDDPARFAWIFGGLILALGLIRLIDRRIWVLRARRARLARREATQEAAKAARLAAEERRQSILQVLSEPVGDEPIEAPEPQTVAQ
jgi:hypothetical protein